MTHSHTTPSPPQYFKSKASLPSTAYWHGVERNESTNTFQYVDASPLPNNYSEVPYAHWAHLYHSKLQQPGLNCVPARGSLSYDFFIGDSSQLALKAFYSSTNDNKYG
jgi:hypothetical protein